jgi:hypothetical protein
MKRLFRMFELSKNEQRVVLIVVFALLAIAFLGYEHRVHYSLLNQNPWRSRKRPGLQRKARMSIEVRFSLVLVVSTGRLIPHAEPSF